MTDHEALAEYAQSADPDPYHGAHPAHGSKIVYEGNGYTYRWNGNTLMYHKTRARQRMTYFMACQAGLM